ncbi:MAG TPA: hypothetical protein VG929_04005 [Actinomycetota bacterium]|nr:hypothetical protein [Actinomycetota bacterium]
MPDATLIKRAHPTSSLMRGGRPAGLLGSRWAFLATAALLLAIFGWTFFTNPGRPAAADDPAYYTWRTEALLVNDPQTLLGVDGPVGMYAGGYRVATPVIGGLLRRILDVAPLTPTILLAVGVRVALPLLLAGFAYRYRRDPLIWHLVALGSASLLLTPPFGGYLDNVITLLFLTGSLYFIEPARTQWRARAAIFVLLLLSGLTHPTTLVIFCLVLGAMAVLRLVLRGFAFRSVLIDDGPMLVSAFLAAVATYVVWKVGVWGEPASVSEAALPPPAPAEFFKTRLGDWVAAMRPPLNGPLFLAGLVGLLASGRRVAEDELARSTIAWLLPLVGVAGVFAGLTYPYYRFFNTTVAWILLVGIGAYMVSRYLLDIAREGGIGVVAVVGVAVVLFVIAGNFRAGLEHSHWNDPSDAWVKPDQQRDLEALRPYLAADPDRPVVFVVDDDAPEPVRIYGFAKLAGNVSRYGIPGEAQDVSGFYLGSLERYLEGVPTERDKYYESLSQASLDDLEAVIPPGEEPVVVVAEVFNEAGSNQGYFEAGGGRLGVSHGPDIVYLSDGEIDAAGDGAPVTGPHVEPSVAGELIRTLLGALLFLVPGVLLSVFLVPAASIAERLGMAVTAGVGLLALVAFTVLAVTRAPLTAGAAWLSYGIALGLSLVCLVAARAGGAPRGAATYGRAA